MGGLFTTCVAASIGEYNLRLGIMKELAPDMVSTYQGAPCQCQQHIPALVSLVISTYVVIKGS
jgi:Topoisomerase VI B subunit, transducer